MATTQDGVIAELQRANAELRRERDAALAQHHTGYGERIAHQAATIDVLKAMSASPGDPQPVFDLIARQAAKLCNVPTAAVATLDGTMLHLATQSGFDSAYADAYVSRFPRPVAADFSMGRAILNRQVEQIEDIATDPTHSFADVLGHWSVIAVPILGDGLPMGAITIGRPAMGPFSDSQIDLLQTFAEQAAIAISGAETYRALQARTSDLQESLEYQTATSDVLKVISRSTFDLQPVLNMLVETAARLCLADQAVIFRFTEQRFHMAANFGFPPAYETHLNAMGLIPFDPASPTVTHRAVGEGRAIHVHDVTTVRGYPEAPIRLGRQRTSLGVPLLREGEPVGVILLAHQRVEPFTDRQIALVSTFADQAVIAIENARLIAEQREALEQQTATAEVLQVINASPGNLAPVFEAILEKAHRLCGATLGSIVTFDGEHFHAEMTHGYPEQYAAWMRGGWRAHPQSAQEELIDGRRFVHVVDLRAPGPWHDHEFQRAFIKATGVRTFLVVPLRKDGILLGFIGAHRKEARGFTDKEITLLESFAAQAVIAMENARLIDELRQRTKEVAELNRGLEARVAAQVEELGRVGRLKRFLAPQLAELIVSQGNERILESHRREIVVVFCDLRGYTAFAETAEPEEVLDFLREYHGALGPLVSQHEGTLDQFSGDGIMVFFNDPVPIPDPAERAVAMAVAMREAASSLIASWRRRGRDLGFGAGIAQGYATLGQIGFSDRSGYTAIGTVCNVAARLCAEARDGQILLSQRIAAGLDGRIALEELGPLALKGLSQPIVAYNVPAAGGQAALRVIEGRPQNVRLGLE